MTIHLLAAAPGVSRSNKALDFDGRQEPAVVLHALGGLLGEVSCGFDDDGNGRAAAAGVSSLSTGGSWTASLRNVRCVGRANPASQNNRHKEEGRDGGNEFVRATTKFKVGIGLINLFFVLLT